ncbi:MAG: hypothetical protein HQL30_07390 [Candidatus Omnitrophica bacterium]|nr:hypothetical protein [Candidatus Omnitrophota bacterium]
MSDRFLIEAAVKLSSSLFMASEASHIYPVISGKRVDITLDPVIISDNVHRFLCRIGENGYTAYYSASSGQVLAIICEKDDNLFISRGLKFRIAERPLSNPVEISPDRAYILIDPAFLAFTEGPEAILSREEADLIIGAYLKAFSVMSFFHWGNKEYSGQPTSAASGYVAILKALANDLDTFLSASAKIKGKYGIFDTYETILDLYSGQLKGTDTAYETFKDIGKLLRANSPEAAETLSKGDGSDFLSWDTAQAMVDLSEDIASGKAVTDVRRIMLISRYSPDKLTSEMIFTMLKQDPKTLSDLFYRLKDLELGRRLVSKRYAEYVENGIRRAWTDEDDDGIITFVERYADVIKYRPDLIKRNIIDRFFRKAGKIRVSTREGGGETTFLPPAGILLKDFFKECLPDIGEDIYNFDLAGSVIKTAIEPAIYARPDLFTKKDLDNIIFFIARNIGNGDPRDGALTAFTALCLKRPSLLSSKAIDSLLKDLIREGKFYDTRQAFFAVNRSAANALRVAARSKPGVYTSEHIITLLKCYQAPHDNDEKKIIGDILTEVLDNSNVSLKEEHFAVFFERADSLYQRNSGTAQAIFEKMLAKQPSQFVKTIARKLFCTILGKTSNDAQPKEAAKDDRYPVLSETANEYLKIAAKLVPGIYDDTLVNEVFCAYLSLTDNEDRFIDLDRTRLLLLLLNAVQSGQVKITDKTSGVLLERLSADEKRLISDESKVLAELYGIFIKNKPQAITPEIFKKCYSLVRACPIEPKNGIDKPLYDMSSDLIDVFSSYSDDEKAILSETIVSELAPDIIQRTSRHDKALALVMKAVQKLCSPRKPIPSKLGEIITASKTRKDLPDRNNEIQYGQAFNLFLSSGYIEFTKDNIDRILLKLESSEYLFYNSGPFDEYLKAPGYDEEYVIRELSGKVLAEKPSSSSAIHSAFAIYISRGKVTLSSDDILKLISLYATDNKPAIGTNKVTRLGVVLREVFKTHPEFLYDPEISKQLKTAIDLKSNSPVGTNIWILDSILSSKVPDADTAIKRFVDNKTAKDLIEIILKDKTPDNRSGAVIAGRIYGDEAGTAFNCIMSLKNRHLDPRVFNKDLFLSLTASLLDPQTRESAAIVLLYIGEAFTRHIDERLMVSVLGMLGTTEDRNVEKSETRNLQRLFMMLAKNNETALSDNVTDRITALIRTASGISSFWIDVYIEMVRHGSASFLGAKTADMLNFLSDSQYGSSNFVSLLKIAIKQYPGILSKNIFEHLVSLGLSGSHLDEEFLSVFGMFLRRDQEWLNSPTVSETAKKMINKLRAGSGEHDLRSAIGDDRGQYFGERDIRGRVLSMLSMLIENHGKFLLSEDIAQLLPVVEQILDNRDKHLSGYALRAARTIIKSFPELIGNDLERTVRGFFESELDINTSEAVDAYREIYLKRPELIRPLSLQKLQNVLYKKPLDDKCGSYDPIDQRIVSFFNFAKICPAILAPKAFDRLYRILVSDSRRNDPLARERFLIYRGLSETASGSDFKAPQKIILEAISTRHYDQGADFLKALIDAHPSTITERIIQSAIKSVLSNDRYNFAFMSSGAYFLNIIMEHLPLSEKYLAARSYTKALGSRNSFIRANALSALSGLTKEFGLLPESAVIEVTLKLLFSETTHEKIASLEMISILLEEQNISLTDASVTRVIELTRDTDKEVARSAARLASSATNLLQESELASLAELLLALPEEQEGWLTHSLKEYVLDTLDKSLDDPTASLTANWVNTFLGYANDRQYGLGPRKILSVLSITRKILAGDTAPKDLRSFLGIIDRVDWSIKAQSAMAEEIFSLLYPGRESGVSGLITYLGKDLDITPAINRRIVSGDTVDPARLQAISRSLSALKGTRSTKAFNAFYSPSRDTVDDIISFLETLYFTGLYENRSALSNFLEICAINNWTLSGASLELNALAEELKKNRFSWWVLSREILDGYDPELLSVQWDILILLLRNGLFPSQALLNSLYGLEDPAREISRLGNLLKSIDSGETDFNPYNPAHAELGYTLYRRLLDHATKKKNEYMYADYRKTLLEADTDDVYSYDRFRPDDDNKAELQYAAYESFQLVELIRDLKDKRKKDIVVIPNLSYGGFIIDPVKTRIEGLGAKVTYARIGSTECHENPYYINPDLFSREDMEYMIRNKPDMIVVDGTVHIDPRDRENKGGRYPDAYTGYRNFLIILEDFLTGGKADESAQLFGVDGEFVRALRIEPEYRRVLRSLLEASGETPELTRGPSFSLEFWNPAGLTLSIREKRMEFRTVESYKPRPSDGPVMIIANSVLPDDNIPLELKRSAGGKPHKPAIFDDNPFIQKFKFKIDPRGIRHNTEISDYISAVYERMESDFNQWPVPLTEQAHSINDLDPVTINKLKASVSIEFNAVVFDYDNTVAVDASIDPVILGDLIGLLRKGVHVGVISGRGRALNRKFLHKISGMLGSDKKALKYLHIYPHNGAKGYNAFSGESEPYYKKGMLKDEALQIERLMRDKFNLFDSIGHFRWSSDMMNIYPVSSADIGLTELAGHINSFFVSEGLPFEAATSKLTIDILPRNIGKLTALMDFSKRTGIPLDRIAKIGDQGQKGGNDHSMLIGRGAFSVDESDRYSSQISMVKATGLTNVQAARWLFRNLKFAPGPMGERPEGSPGNSILRQIEDPSEAAVCLLEEMLSFSFSKKIVLLFEDSLALEHPESPLAHFTEAIEFLKGNEKYKNISRNIEIRTSSIEGLFSAAKEYSTREDTELFTFSSMGSRDGLNDLEQRRNVHTSYLDDDNFPMEAYYPLTEIVVISIAESLSPSILGAGATKELRIPGSSVLLDKINIGSIKRDRNSLIFTLLPDAVTFDRNELLGKYAYLKRFLKAA